MKFIKLFVLSSALSLSLSLFVLSGCGDNGAGGGGGNTTHTHTWGEWVVTTPATCVAMGTKTRTCTKGDTSETMGILVLTGADCLVDPNTVVKSTFTDSRDSKTYKTVKIGSQTWMAENLNYQTDDSWCYEDKAANCAQYGRLYKITSALGACPSGWHLSKSAEWSALEKAAGEKRTAGTKLKSTTGWDDNGNGTDDFGFSALPGGLRNGANAFQWLGFAGQWWTSSQWGETSYSQIYILGSEVQSKITSDGYYGYSVRCVKTD
jgi:uncharacterized protein (TIGR02145 family)